jgi:hypothetical protein
MMAITSEEPAETGGSMKCHRWCSRLVAACTFLFAPACFADAVLDWNAVALSLVDAASQPAPDDARSMAMVHVAIFDAVNAVDRRFEAYAFSDRAPAGASADAAASAAARAVLIGLFPNQRQQIDSAYASSLSTIVDGNAKTMGISVGERAGATCLAMRGGDGSGTPNEYRPRTAPGVYVATALPVSWEWAAVKPWIMKSPSQFRPGPPPALTSPHWARDYEEIRAVGGRQSVVRTPAQTEAARFWTIVGPASWNPVVRSLALSRSARLVDNARLFALVNMAATDAFIAVFDAKYAHNFWRPVTAIRNGDMDGNDATHLDGVWLPLVDTPMHPEYPCAHCIAAGAVAAVLESEFGTGEVAPVTMASPTAPGVTHRWTRIADYVTEVDNARIWGGLHYRNSTQVGEAMGRKLGTLALAEILEPLARQR